MVMSWVRSPIFPIKSIIGLIEKNIEHFQVYFLMDLVS